MLPHLGQVERKVVGSWAMSGSLVMPEKQAEGSKAATPPTEVIEMGGIESLIKRETSFKIDGRRMTFYTRLEVGKSGD